MTRGRPVKQFCICGVCRPCRLEDKALNAPKPVQRPEQLSPLVLAILNEDTKPKKPAPATPKDPDTLPDGWLPPEKKTKRNANAEKTHCDAGHEFTDENTRMQRSGNGHLFRACVTCRRDKQRERWRRKQAELKAQKAQQQRSA